MMCSSRNCLFKSLLLGKYEYFLELHYAKVCRTNQCCKSLAKEGNGKDTHPTKKQTLSWIPYLLNFTLFSLNRSSQIQNLLIHVRVMRKCYVHMYTVFVANENIIIFMKRSYTNVENTHRFLTSCNFLTLLLGFSC